MKMVINDDIKGMGR